MRFIILEGDSFLVTAVLKTSKLTVDWRIEDIIHEARQMLNSFPYWEIRKIYCTAHSHPHDLRRRLVKCPSASHLLKAFVLRINQEKEPIPLVLEPF